MQQCVFPYTPVFRSEADAEIKSPRVGSTIPRSITIAATRRSRGRARFWETSSDSMICSRKTRELVQGMIDVYSEHPGHLPDYAGFRVDTAKHVNDEFWQVRSCRPSRPRPLTPAGTISSCSPRSSPRTRSSHRRTRRTWGSHASLDFRFDSAVRQFVVGGADASDAGAGVRRR